MVNLTPKELTLINDLKEQEKLCIQKYQRYAQQACDNRLKCLFQELEQHENHHLQMLDQITQGQVPPINNAQGQQGNQSSSNCQQENTCSQQDWQKDQFLCADALNMEKHVSSTYDTSIFEFAQPELRDVLNSIQKQEQEHGEKIYQYMQSNNMYN